MSCFAIEAHYEAGALSGWAAETRIRVDVRMSPDGEVERLTRLEAPARSV